MRRHGISGIARPALLALFLVMSPTLSGPAAASPDSVKQVLDALRDQIARCYVLPRLKNPRAVTLRLRFDRDGISDGPPVVVERSNTPEFQLAAAHFPASRRPVFAFEASERRTVIRRFQLPTS